MYSKGSLNQNIFTFFEEVVLQLIMKRCRYLTWKASVLVLIYQRFPISNRTDGSAVFNKK